MTAEKSEWVFGMNPVVEAIRAGPKGIKEILVARRMDGRLREIKRLAGKTGIRIRHVEKRDIDRISGNIVNQGIAASLESGFFSDKPEEDDPVMIAEKAKLGGEIPLVLALDQVQDPGNLGALVRSAHAFGAHCVVVTRDRASGMTPVAIRASAGAASYIPVCRVTNLSRTLNLLKKAGLWVVGAESCNNPTIPVSRDASKEASVSKKLKNDHKKNEKNKKSSSKGLIRDAGSSHNSSFSNKADLKNPLVLVLGSEGSGLRKLVKEQCDQFISIPMAAGEVGSLNVSVAGGILLYEVMRQREQNN